MRAFDPLTDVEDADRILVEGRWPNFHDAEVDELRYRTGDIRPDDDVWTGASLTVRLTLHAERRPPVLRLHFRDCEGIRFAAEGPHNSIHDLELGFEARGFYRDGVTPLPPFLQVRFLPHGSAVDASLEFRCFGLRAEKLGELPDNHSDLKWPFDDPEETGTSDDLRNR